MKYKDQEGNYLVVAESGYRFAWFIVEWNDYGLFLGGKERTPTDPLERKMLQIADEFAEGRDVTGFFFGSGSKARAALIESLRSEAGREGDGETVEMCCDALDGSEVARQSCEIEVARRRERANVALVRSIDRDQVEALQDANHELFDVCNRALGGDFAAQVVCARAIMGA